MVITLKKIIIIKLDLVTSNGERLIVPPKTLRETAPSEVEFQEKVIFHEFDFYTSDLELEVSKSSI